MADKDKAGPSTASDNLIDFAALPASALDSYITFFDLARSYPPPPSKRSPSHDSAAADEHGDDDLDGDDGDERDGASRSGGRRASRVSNRNIEEGNTITTSSRLRPRSPPLPSSGDTSMKRNASTANLDENGHLNGTVGLVTRGAAAADDPDPSPSHFFDVQEADEYLAGVAKRHFAAQPQPKEGEVVVQFLYRCRAGDKILKVAT